MQNIIVGQGKKGAVIKSINEKYGPVAIKYYKQGPIYTDMFERIHKEVKILTQLADLHQRRIYPGQIFTLETNVREDDINCDNYIMTKKPYVMMQLYDYSLLYIMTKYHAKWIYKSIIFQIIIQIIVIHKYLHILHSDLHSDNILIKKVNPSTKIVYLINNKKYIVPTYGYQVSIVDFDSSRFINNNNNKPEFIKFCTFWHNIIFYYLDKSMRDNIIVMDALKILRNTDYYENNKKLWYWYDKTKGKGVVDRKLFKLLLESGFNYESLLPDNYNSLIKYIIKLMTRANITPILKDVSYLNLDVFGYHIDEHPVDERHPVDYIINYN